MGREIWTESESCSCLDGGTGHVLLYVSDPVKPAEPPLLCPSLPALAGDSITAAMVGFTRPRTFRDVALIFLGAAGMHFTTSFLGPFTEHTSSIVVQTQVSFRLLPCDPCVPRAYQSGCATSVGLAEERKYEMVAL